MRQWINISLSNRIARPSLILIVRARKTHTHTRDPGYPFAGVHPIGSRPWDRDYASEIRGGRSWRDGARSFAQTRNPKRRRWVASVSWRPWKRSRRAGVGVDAARSSRKSLSFRPDTRCNRMSSPAGTPRRPSHPLQLSCRPGIRRAFQVRRFLVDYSALEFFYFRGRRILLVIIVKDIAWSFAVRFF